MPPNVEWKGETSTVSERVNYNSDTRVVFWNVGNVSAGAGFTNSPKEVSFKVGLTPSINQVGLAPAILGETTVESTDAYTETKLESKAETLTTRFFDLNFKNGNEIVTK